MDFIKYALLAAIVYFIVSKVYEGFREGPSGATRHCMTCGTDGEPKTETRGSIVIEIVLWLMFIVPGLIYSIWRLTTKRPVCRACGSATLVPYDAPAAVNHRRTLQQPTQQV
jgi:hypothetical protein